MDKVNFKKATLEDCKFISSLFTNDEYQDIFAENETTTESWKDRFQYYKNYNNFIIYDSSTDEKIGWILFEIEGKESHLHLIVFKYGILGRSFGYISLLKMRDYLQEKVNSINLDVQKRNIRAVELYKRFGCEIIGEEEQKVSNGSKCYWNMKYLIS